MKKLICIYFLVITVMLTAGAGCQNSSLETYEILAQPIDSSAKTITVNTEYNTPHTIPPSSTSTQNSVHSESEKFLPSSTTPTKPNTVREFLMGDSKDRSSLTPSKNYRGIGEITKEHNLGIGPRIDFNHSSARCTATTTPDEFEQMYCLGQNVYTFEDESTLINAKEATIHNLLLNGKKVVGNIFEGNNAEFLQNVRLVNNQLAFTFWQNWNSTENKIQPDRSNIYYNGETFNEKYRAQGTHYLFAYKKILGFVIKQNNKEHVFFNNKIISPPYDQVVTYGCCMNIHHFVVFQNGKLHFIAVKDEKDYLVEIDLNEYLK